MADLGGDSASMMGSFDPSAFTGRDEDLFLPGDSLFGFSAAEGIGGSPDVGGGSGGGSGDGDAPFQGGSASMLFPPSAASFQAMASLPPESDSTPVSAAGATTARAASRSRRGVVGGAGGGSGIGAGCSGGGAEGADESTQLLPPLPKAPSLKLSLNAAIVSATARDAANAAAAAAAAATAATAAKGTATTETKKAAAKPKSSARPRRRNSGGRGRGIGSSSSSSKPMASGGSSIEDGAGAVAGAMESAGEARRPTRNLRTPRQESNKKSEQAAAAAGTPAVLSPSGGNIVGSPRRRVAASNRKGGGAAKQRKNTATTTSDASAAAAAGGGRSASSSNTTARPQRGGSPCRPPPRRTSLQQPLPAAENGGSGEEGKEIGLPVGMELIPGFEDTIDSHFMTALLQKSPDAQSSDPVSAFACADGHGSETAGGGRDESSAGGRIDFGIDADASLGFTAGVLLGSDSQPSAAPATAGTADAKQGYAAESADQAAPKTGADGAASGTSVDVARASTAHRGSGVAVSSPAPAEAQTDGAATVAAAPPLPSSTPEPPEPAGPASSTAAAVTVPAVTFSSRAMVPTPASPEVPATVGPTASVSPSLDTAGVLTTAVRPCQPKCDSRAESTKCDATDPPRPTTGQQQQQTEAKTKTPPAAAAAKPPRETSTASKTVEGRREPRPLAAAAPSPANVGVVSDEVQVDVGTEPAARAASALRQHPASLGTRTVTTELPRKATPVTVRGAPQALLLPRPPILMVPRGAFPPALAPVATVGVGSGGFFLPAAPVRAVEMVRSLTPAPALAPAPVPVTVAAPSRPLPRKVSLRFSPRDASTEDKLSKHGYLPFQKLTAPLKKDLEAVFKFMMKKWSEVPYSDLNSIRIVFDVFEADRNDSSAAAARLASSSAPSATIVWSAEQSSKSLANLVSSLPHSTLERIREEKVLNLTYTFSTGPVGPPPSHGTAPWDIPHGVPATAAAPRLPPPPTRPQPSPMREPPVASSIALRPPVGVSGGQAEAGEPVAVRPPGSAAESEESAAPPAAEGAATRAAVLGPRDAGKKKKSAVDAAPGGAGGSSASGKVRRATRGTAVPADASEALKKRYKNVTRRFKRQGILSPPVTTHFLPGGLFARMHDAATGGGPPGTPGGTGPVPAAAEVPPGTSVEATLNSATGDTAKGEKDAHSPRVAEDPMADSFDGGLDASDRGGGGGGGFEGFGGDANSEAEEAGDGAGGALMGEETCMAFFGGNGVELLVDPPPPPTKTVEAARARDAGQENGVDNGIANPAALKVSPPTADGVEASASPPESVGGDAPTAVDARQPPAQAAPAVPEARGGVASPLPPAAAAGREADSALPPGQPPTVDGVAVEAQSDLPPASPPHGDCALVGEETCMALFGGNGVELLVDPPSSSSQAGSATGMREGGAEGLADAGAAAPAVQPAPTPPIRGREASASVARLAGGETGERLQPGSPPSLARAAVNAKASAKSDSTPPSPSPPGVVCVAAVGTVRETEASGSAEKAGQQSTTQPEAGAAAMAETKQSTPPSSPPRTADGPCAGLKRAPLVGYVCKGTSLGSTNGGTAVVSEAPKDEVGVAPPPRLDDGGAAVRTAVAATPAFEQPPPPPSSRSSPLFRMGKLPSRSRFGRPPPPALGFAAPSLATEEEDRPDQSTAGPSTSPAQALPRPPSAAGQAATSSSNGAGVGCLSTGDQRQSGPEPAAVVAEAATEGVLRVESRLVDTEAEAKVMSASAVVSEAAAGCKDAGGGGAVTVTSPPAMASAQHTADTARSAAAAAEDAVLSQTGGTRKLTRSHSNGGDPALHGTSGGGRSSRPEEGGRISKRARREGTPSATATPPQVGGIPQKTGAKRRRDSSGKGKGEGSERKRIAPTVQSSGGPPQRASSPVFDSPAAGVPPAATAAPVLATGAARPFAFASSKKADVEASGEGPPLPPLGGGGDVPAVMPADPEPGSTGVCAFVPRPAEAYEPKAGDRMGAVLAVEVSPAVRTPAAAPPATPARPFAFAAAAQKCERGELLRAGASLPTTAAGAAGQAATTPRQSDVLSVPGVEASSAHSRSPPNKGGGASEGLISSPLPAPVRNSVSASLSLSMSPEEVQAGYSEAWSSLPSCFWDESALVGDGDGAADGGAKGEQLTDEGPVTRWLALPQAGPTLGETAAVAAPTPVPASSAPAPAAAPVAAPCCEGHRGDGGKESGAEAAAPRRAGPAFELTQRKVKQSRWASFCTAFAASRGSSCNTSAGATAAAAAAASSTCATEETRSLPTLIRLGRSMTKGVSPVEKESSDGEGKGSPAAAAAAAASAAPATWEDPQTSGGVAEVTGAPASAPARASLVAGRPGGSSGAVLPAGAKGGGGSDMSASGALSGTRRKRADGGGGSDDCATGGGDAGGGNEAAGAVAAATALPKKRAKKKGRIAPVFVSGLPPDSFGTIARSFSSNRRA